MARTPSSNPESERLAEDERREKNWKRWGTYLPERQWGTVREDYSADGESWNYLTHEQARSRAYRWGEDGLLGLTDRECRLCFALALWNERDPLLKERLFGLSGFEGNHGEDVKECYFYLDATPTHSWSRALYKYPQAAFPYDRLRTENHRRGRDEPEFEILDTGVFDDNRYFDVFAEYAKAGPNDLCLQITVANRGPEPARLHVLPTLWFRNSWSWGCRHEGCEVKPRLAAVSDQRVQCDHVTLGRYFLELEPGPDNAAAPLLFTENETNATRLFGTAPTPGFYKDAFHDAVVGGRGEAVNPRRVGTKCAAHHVLVLAPGEERVLRLRLYADGEKPAESFGRGFASVVDARRREADAFYAVLVDAGAESKPASGGSAFAPGSGAPPSVDCGEARRVARQAYAGLLWSKQFYHYVVKDWLAGDPDQPPPPATATGRTYTRAMSSRCRTSGNTPGLPPGTWRFT